MGSVSYDSSFGCENFTDEGEEKAGGQRAHEDAGQSLHRAEQSPLLRKHQVAVTHGGVGNPGKIERRLHIRQAFLPPVKQPPRRNLREMQENKRWANIKSSFGEELSVKGLILADTSIFLPEPILLDKKTLFFSRFQPRTAFPPPVPIEQNTLSVSFVQRIFADITSDFFFRQIFPSAQLPSPIKAATVTEGHFRAAKGYSNFPSSIFLNDHRYGGGPYSSSSSFTLPFPGNAPKIFNRLLRRQRLLLRHCRAGKCECDHKRDDANSPTNGSTKMLFHNPFLLLLFGIRIW
jgi:hypothetical protein